MNASTIFAEKGLFFKQIRMQVFSIKGIVLRAKRVVFE